MTTAQWKWCFLVMLWVTLWGVGCNHAPRIAEYDQQLYEEIYSAPLVIVGVADSDSRIGGQQPSKRNPAYPMQLHRVRVRIENVLKGSLSDRTILVYYFGFAGGIVGPRPLGFGREPSRRIFWLRGDSGVLRMACDGWDQCTMFVDSGAHPQYTPEPGKPLAYALADILFTRGQGEVNENKFARDVAWGAPSTIPEDYVLKKFTHLALTEGPSIRAAACSQLWICTQDSGSEAVSRRNAEQAMRNAGCHCDKDPSGNPHCR